MKLLNIFLFFTILLKTCVATEHNLDEDNKDNSSITITPFVYQIFKENTDAENPAKIFLVGSMHTLPATALTEEVKHLIGSGDILIKEQYSTAYYDYPELCEYADVSLETLQSKGYFKQDFAAWPEKLSKENFKWLRDQIGKDFEKPWGLGLSEVPPSIINYIVQQAIERTTSKLLISNSQSTLDTSIQELYLNKKIIGLENGQDRLTVSGTLDKLATEDLQTSLQQIEEKIANLQFLNTPEGKEKLKENFLPQALSQLKQMEEAFISSDIERLKPFINEETIKRNELWLPKITKIINNNSDTSITIMVTAGHLAGENGLLALLTQAGYNVKKVN